MRKNFGAKPFLYPQPVLIIATYDENGKPNAMNAAWGGICGMNKINISLSSHKTTDNLKATGAFTVSVADAKHVIMSELFRLGLKQIKWRRQALQPVKVSL